MKCSESAGSGFRAGCIHDFRICTLCVRCFYQGIGYEKETGRKLWKRMRESLVFYSQTGGSGWEEYDMLGGNVSVCWVKACTIVEWRRVRWLFLIPALHHCCHKASRVYWAKRMQICRLRRVLSPTYKRIEVVENKIARNIKNCYPDKNLVFSFS